MRKKMKVTNYRTMALVLVCLCFSALSKIHAQGPTAPEAASFEPVDATDMVNLSTGDFTYVLPLLNIPSPEGGYPISLAYHAGIAMDQDASWTGLGWNLNPGAINRGINGYPDDYNSTLINEFFYDEGGQQEIYSLSLGFSSHAGVSVGLGFSWGSNKSLGGTVSIGAGGLKSLIKEFGVSIGQSGVGFNLKAGLAGGMSLGMGASTSGGFKGSLGFNNNGSGFSISTSGSVDYSIAVGGDGPNDSVTSLDINMSSKGVGFSAGITNKRNNKVVGGLGVGAQHQFQSTYEMGDYTYQTSGSRIPLVLPTPVGIFSLSFGKQKLRYALAKNENKYVNGPIYFKDGTENIQLYQYVWRDCQATYETEIVEIYSESSAQPNNPIISTTGEYYTSVFYLGYDSQTKLHRWDCAWFSYNTITTFQNTPPLPCYTLQQTIPIGEDEAFMDIYEVPLEGVKFSEIGKEDFNNPSFPNYDRYSVQAQGLSGNMSSRLYDNGVLFGLANKQNDRSFSLKYAINGSSSTLPDHAMFNKRPEFYFDNEISTHYSIVDVNPATFNTSTYNYNEITDYYSGGAPLNDAKLRRKNANFIEYYTNEEIKNNYTTLKGEGYLKPNGTGFDRIKTPDKGIGAFKITSIDGKTYHYSLPVYNQETITRVFGSITTRPDEDQSYFEKRQLEPYATHWLLTAVTGPDYYDKNDNGIADSGDYGYWVSFDYGKWSDAFVWKNPYGEDYLEEGATKKTWLRGRKEMYYLDRIKTRTHTAVFVKSERQDGISPAWDYSSVSHVDGIVQDHNSYTSRFVIPLQKSLRLDKIILIKNQYDNVSKTHGPTNQGSVSIEYNNANKPAETAWYSIKDNVIDSGDNWSGLLTNSIKVIDLNYASYFNSLVEGSPNTTSPSYGRLTLESVDFKGKSNTDIMPPYQFDYLNDTGYAFNIDDKDDFGYKTNDNSLWSMNKITTPTGGTISINYESNTFRSVIPLSFTRSESTGGTSYGTGQSPPTEQQWFYADVSFDIEPEYNVFSIGDPVDIKIDGWVGLPRKLLEGTGTITAINGNTITITPPQNQPLVYLGNSSNSCFPYGACWYKYITADFYIGSNYTFTNQGGARVASLVTSNGIDSYTTQYKYGENEDGIGYISYIPSAPDALGEIPYSSELPAPKVMYEYVAVESVGSDNSTTNGKMQYKFKILKEKDPNSIKFGDIYEIVVTQNQHTNSTANKDVYINTYTIKDNLASVGQLLEVNILNKFDHVMSKVENTYYGLDETPSLFGVTQESYQTYKEVDYESISITDKWIINSSTRVKYPSLLKYASEFKQGKYYTTRFGGLDPITGQANETFSYSSEGIKFKTKNIPAYTKYSQMGTKVNSTSNRNMLSQSAGSFSYLIDPNTGLNKITSASIDTWSNEWDYRIFDGNITEHGDLVAAEKIWRKHKNYTWSGDINSDGTFIGYNMISDDSFNWAVSATQTNPKWLANSEVTLYDRFSHIKENKDVNGNYSSEKRGDSDGKVLAVGNAMYTELFYSSAEYLSQEYGAFGSWLDGEIGSLGRTSEKAHLGNYSIKVSPGQQGFYSYLSVENFGKFKVSVWVHKDNYTNARVYNGSSVVTFNGETTIAGEWVLMNHYFDTTSAATLIYVTSNSGNVYFDDIRISPISATIKSYVYNEYDELWFLTGGNGLSTQYIYDELGRLEETWIEVVDNHAAGIIGGFKRVTKNTYRYKNQ